MRALKVALAMPWRADAQQTLDLAGQFHSSAAGTQAPRTASVIYTGDSPVARSFFEQLATAGGLLVHQGQMIERCCLSVLKDA